jgi:hypothetical protein
MIGSPIDALARGVRPLLWFSLGRITIAPLPQAMQFYTNVGRHGYPCQGRQLAESTAREKSWSCVSAGSNAYVGTARIFPSTLDFGSLNLGGDSDCGKTHIMMQIFQVDLL